MGDITLNRHPRKALTAKFVESIKIKGKYFDGHGLFLRVTPNGTKQWVQRITINGKRTEIGLGSAIVIPLSMARKNALENYISAKSGQNPLAHRNRLKNHISFQELAKRVHEIHRKGWRNEKHAAQFISTLETYVFPFIGTTAIHLIETTDILKCLYPIWNEKHETAKRVKQRISLVMKHAIAEGLRPDNPTLNAEYALPKVFREPRRMRSLPYFEVSECIDATKNSNAEQITKLAIEFLILTASRSGEVRNAEWSQISFSAGEDLFNAKEALWVRPASIMKAKTEHIVPLNKRCLEILRAAYEFKNEETDLIFRSKRNRVLSDMTLSKLVKSLGYEVDVHGFRTSFKTWCQEQTNAPREVSEAALAHTIKDKAEAAYARSNLLEKRKTLMDDWSLFLELNKTNVRKLHA